jgi:hypothetical protein
MTRDIMNEMVVEKLVALIEKLLETRGMRIFKRGFEKAVELLEKSEERGVFVWAPSLRYWLKDPDYIFWLGTVRWKMKQKEMDEKIVVRSDVFYEGITRTVFGSIDVELFSPELPFIAYQSQPCQSSHEPIDEFLSHFITPKFFIIYLVSMVTVSALKIFSLLLKNLNIFRTFLTILLNFYIIQLSFWRLNKC